MLFPTAWHVLPVVLLFCALTPAQQKPAPNPSSVSARVPVKPLRPKLTPDQRRGLRLLNASQGEAAALQPEMRAFILWQVSHGYSKVLPAKSDATLKEAFQVTESMDQENAPEGCDWEVCHMKKYLQLHLAEEFMNRSESTGQFAEIEQMLPRLEPEVRRMVMARLIMHYAGKNEFARARALLDQVGDDEEYPYYAANELLLQDPSPEDRLAVFDGAVAHFRQEPKAQPEGEDLATLVIRFSRDLPSASVLDAIDQIFARAREQDEEQKTRVGVTSTKSSVYFESRYEFRLFQLLAVLEDLDKSRAESLLRENAQVGKALGDYPRGMQSMYPDAYGDKPLPEGQYPDRGEVDVIASKDPSGAAAEQAMDQAAAQIELKMRKVMTEVDKDPQQAYEDAQQIPLDHPMGPGYSPRAEALARGGVERHQERSRGRQECHERNAQGGGGHGYRDAGPHAHRRAQFLRGSGRPGRSQKQH